jgi:hypothetical protein
MSLPLKCKLLIIIKIMTDLSKKKKGATQDDLNENLLMVSTSL